MPMPSLRRAAVPSLSLLSLLATTSLLSAQDAPKVDYVDAFPKQADFDRAIYLDHHAADPGHYWIVEQYGRIWRIPTDPATDVRQQVADLSEICYHPKNGGHNEEGLLGFAFHPEWDGAGGHVFVYYSRYISGEKRNKKRESVIARYATVAKDGGYALDMDSALVVMRVAQPYGNHNGGTIVFGPDQMLYVALGDGGAANDPHGNGQNLGSLLGSVLRIDVREATADAPYQVPADNPFVDTDGAKPEIFAYGVRNPWRMSFDRETGELWCGDVGQNLWEEVGRLVAGGNHGWNKMEGTHPFPPEAELPDEERQAFVMPAAEYKHPVGISVTGGYVYRGEAIPALQGCFLYGDFAMRRIWAVQGSAPGSQVLELGRCKGMLASWAEEPDGELLLLTFDGRIRRLVAAAD